MLELDKNPTSGEELFILDHQAHFLAHINAQNHIHMHYLCKSQEIEKTYQQLLILEQELSQTVTFSFNKKFGYLTTNPHEAGTALVCSSYLHLPALIHTQKLECHKEKINNQIQVLGLTPQGQYIGDLIHIKNKCTLGILEETIIQQVQRTKTMLLELEMKERGELKVNKDKKIQDKISRAFGLVSCASQLQTFEALNALSLIELGKSLNWINGLEKIDFHSLFFKTQRAHLPFFSKNIKEMQISRADLLHQELKKAKLCF